MKLILTLYLMMSSLVMLSCQEKESSTLTPAESLSLENELASIRPEKGATIRLESGRVYKGSIVWSSIDASEDPITITSTGAEPAVIDAQGHLAGILLNDCSGIHISNLEILADGNGKQGHEDDPGRHLKMRCGILVRTTHPGICSDIQVSHCHIHHIYYENNGYDRENSDTYTPNGNAAYGYGIRFMTAGENCVLNHVKVTDCQVHHVSHTGIKFTGKFGTLNHIEVARNEVTEVGGPGGQMSGVHHVHFHHNNIDHSGSVNDTRNWKRGSGYWCWGAQDILLEHNTFTHAHGPLDSAGAHIDFNCSDIVLQYNFSGWNDGGFVEILGNDHNCCYRYNISVDDGARIKGKNGAGHDGQTLWLSGFVGKGKQPHGPYDTYIYNNTIFVSDRLESHIRFEQTVDGVLVANNIFCITGKCHDNVNYSCKKVKSVRKRVTFRNNLYLHENMLPEIYTDGQAFYGDPLFVDAGGGTPESYIPSAFQLIMQGSTVLPMEGDEKGLTIGMDVEKDFFGNTITAPIMGAVIPISD